MAATTKRRSSLQPVSAPLSLGGENENDKENSIGGTPATGGKGKKKALGSHNAKGEDRRRHRRRSSGDLYAGCSTDGLNIKLASTIPTPIKNPLASVAGEDVRLSARKKAIARVKESKLKIEQKKEQEQAEKIARYKARFAKRDAMIAAKGRKTPKTSVSAPAAPAPAPAAEPAPAALPSAPAAAPSAKSPVFKSWDLTSTDASQDALMEVAASSEGLSQATASEEESSGSESESDEEELVDTLIGYVLTPLGEGEGLQLVEEIAASDSSNGSRDEAVRPTRLEDEMDGEQAETNDAVVVESSAVPVVDVVERAAEAPTAGKQLPHTPPEKSPPKEEQEVAATTAVAAATATGAEEETGSVDPTVPKEANEFVTLVPSVGKQLPRTPPGKESPSAAEFPSEPTEATPVEVVEEAVVEKSAAPVEAEAPPAAEEDQVPVASATASPVVEQEQAIVLPDRAHEMPNFEKPARGKELPRTPPGKASPSVPAFVSEEEGTIEAAEEEATVEAAEEATTMDEVAAEAATFEEAHVEEIEEAELVAAPVQEAEALPTEEELPSVSPKASPSPVVEEQEQAVASSDEPTSEDAVQSPAFLGPLSPVVSDEPAQAHLDCSAVDEPGAGVEGASAPARRIQSALLSPPPLRDSRLQGAPTPTNTAFDQTIFRRYAQHLPSPQRTEESVPPTRSSISRRFVLCAILVFTFVVVLGSAVVGLRQAFDSPAFETSENSFFKTLASIMRTYFSAARPERTLGTCWAEDQTSFVAYSCTH